MISAGCGSVLLLFLNFVTFHYISLCQSTGRRMRDSVVACRFTLACSNITTKAVEKKFLALSSDEGNRFKRKRTYIAYIYTNGSYWMRDSVRYYFYFFFYYFHFTSTVYFGRSLTFLRTHSTLFRCTHTSSGFMLQYIFI